jgi:hypothetical protein
VSPTEARRGRQQKRARKALRKVEERIEQASAQPEVPAPIAFDSDELPPPAPLNQFRPPHNHD